MKKALAWLMAAVMAAALLTGCGGGAGGPQSGDAQAALANFTYDPSKPSWQQDTSPIELEWFVAYDWEDLNFDPENNTFDKIKSPRMMYMSFAT